ncbi:uncharacterized protein LAJ45_04872 [Morchella importuna]|uniref:uncharacterized protein n=1 Tax=Morchella importuna TaxID=1174673 RepID=UPI001E8E6250|nr:uncharacterized protein LAJ45_04872 [Morchella importuna]KAH8151170.1 hypothetical protein LAJ45_04872 [Morchella importuna]
MQPHRPQTSFHTPPSSPPPTQASPPLPHALSPSSSHHHHLPPPHPRPTAQNPRRPPPPHPPPHAPHRLLPPPRPHPPSTLRQRHLATLTTLLHTALSSNDLPRAARAYALLLRTPTTDIRTFWRLGVELLLRRNEPQRAVELVTRLALAYPYQKGTHALHAALNDGEYGGEEGRLARPSVLEFVPALLEVLVLVGEEEGGARGGGGGCGRGWRGGWWGRRGRR